LAGAPSREASAARRAAGAAGQGRRPVVVRGLEGALVPTRPESARGRRPGQRCQRAKRPRWPGAWREAKGWRWSRIAAGRMVPLRRGHPVQTEAERGEALTQVKKAGVLPEGQVRRGVVGDGAEWIGKHVPSLCAHARQGLDSSHWPAYRHQVAKAHEGTAQQARAGVEATLPRLYGGNVRWVRGGLRRMPATAGEAAKARPQCWDSLQDHRARTHYRQCRRGG